MYMTSDDASKRPLHDSLEMFIPGGLPVLRIAVEDLVSSGWSELFRRRASEIACAVEGSFRAFKRVDLAALAHSLVLLLELDYREANDLGPALPEKLTDLLGKMEALLAAEGDTKTG
jgi:hypothetical protein